MTRLAGVSERTVWSDIAAGSLASIRLHGRRLVPRAAIAAYRNLGDENLLTVQEVSELLEISGRTVRRYIKRGRFAAVKFSARQMRVDAAHSWWASDQHPEQLISIADLIGERRAANRGVARAIKAQRQRQRRLIRTVVRAMAERLEHSTLLMTVRFVATMCERSRRTVYQDVAKGALRACSNHRDTDEGTDDVLPIVTMGRFGGELRSKHLRPSSGRGHVVIGWRDVLAYAPAAARPRIIWRVAYEYYADVSRALFTGDDVVHDQSLEILEEFCTWMTEQFDAEFSSAKR